MDATLTPLPIGPALAVARLTRGMKQAHAAELLEVAQSTVSRTKAASWNPRARSARACWTCSPLAWTPSATRL